MRLFPRSLLCVFVSGLACGAPAELDESIFPKPNETGYSDAQLGGASGAGLGGQSPIGQGGRSSGTGGSSNASQGGSIQVGAGGAAMNIGGSNAGGSANSMAGGSSSAGSGQMPNTGGSATGGSGNGGCPDDITVLFKRPGAQGGCEGGGCHVPGGSRPDLVSPNPEERLLNVASSCKSRPYIGPDDSFLAEKITVAGPDCGGAAMPFLSPQALSAQDEQCILDWIDEVAGN